MVDSMGEGKWLKFIYENSLSLILYFTNMQKTWLTADQKKWLFLIDIHKLNFGVSLLNKLEVSIAFPKYFELVCHKTIDDEIFIEENSFGWFFFEYA